MNIRRGEVLGTIAALAGLGVTARAVIHEVERLPGSYKEQIQQALGSAGLEANNLSVRNEAGEFTFNQGKKPDEEVCQGRFGSNNGIEVDIDPLLNCVPADGIEDQINLVN